MELLALPLVAGLAEIHPLEHPQHVAGGEYGAYRPDDHRRAEQAQRKTREGVVGANEGHELTPETGETGQPERCHGGEGENPTHYRHQLDVAAESCHVPCVIPVLHGSGYKKEETGDQTVGNHADDRCVDADVGHRGDSQHDKAHVTYRRKGDQTFQVMLGKTRQRAVDDPDHRQNGDERRPGHRFIREDRQ